MNVQKVWKNLGKRVIFFNNKISKLNVILWLTWNIKIKQIFKIWRIKIK